MRPDFVASVQSDSDRIGRALDAGRDAPIPWCGDWTVKDCVRHVGAVQHVVTRVIADRPTATFGLFKTLTMPDGTDPTLGRWMTEGTASLVAEMQRAPADDAAWSWWDADRTVGFWSRRMAHETLVHRWDVEKASGVPIVATDPELASDGIDEYLDVFVGLQRMVSSAPGAGETAHVHCTDTPGEWFIEFPAAGERSLRREHAKGDVAFRGPAEGLLLFLWGRLRADDAGVEIVGDASIARRWRELAPPI